MKIILLRVNPNGILVDMTAEEFLKVEADINKAYFGSNGILKYKQGNPSSGTKAKLIAGTNLTAEEADIVL